MAEDSCASARARLVKEFEDIWTHVDLKYRHEEATSLLEMRSTMDRMWEAMKTNREKQRLELQTAFNEKLSAAAEPSAPPQQEAARAQDEGAAGQNKRKADPQVVECIICMEPWSDTVVRHGFGCGHALYCRDCCDQWITSQEVAGRRKKFRCPVRCDLGKNKAFHRVYLG